MIRIAICDDDKQQLLQIQTLLEMYQSAHSDIELYMECFLSGISLLDAIRTSGNFDIYLLDILIPIENGIELGLKIRAIDSGGHIIYITHSSDYAVDSYLVRATQYLLKPIEKEQFFLCLDHTLSSLKQTINHFVILKTRNGYQRIPLQSIVYGELIGHCIQYQLNDGQILIGTSIRTSFKKAVASFLQHQNFVLCAISFFVNLNYIEMIEPTGIKLSNGRLLPLSRTLRTEVTNRWLDYHLKERGSLV